MKNWKTWTVIWITLYIITSVVGVVLFRNIYWISLFSVTLLAIYEFFFLPHLGRKGVGLRAQLTKRMDKYKPTEAEYDRIVQKIAIGATTLSILASVAFTLIVFSLGFLYLAKVQIGINVTTILIFGMLIPLIIAAICYLIALDQHDTAADPSLDVNTKWKMRKLSLGYFVYGWYFLIFGILVGLSLLHPLLTIIGSACYVTIHNRFWFQTL